MTLRPKGSWDTCISQGGFSTFLHAACTAHDAVKAGVTLPWSTGPVEGQINRLKMLKRQMYGRARMALLRQRVVAGVGPALGTRSRQTDPNL
jgi:hypothetical protein